MRKIKKGIPRLLACVGFLWGIHSIVSHAQPVTLDDTSHSIPAHLTKLNRQSIQTFSINSNALLVEDTAAKAHYLFSFPFIDTPLIINREDAIIHTNGDVSLSKRINMNNAARQIIFTQGEGVGIGEIRGGGQHLYFEQRGTDLFIVDLGISGLLPAVYENDVVGQLAQINSQASGREVIREAPVIVDIMLLFTQNIVDEFPGAMTQALLNQLIMRANQAFVDSDISMQLRLVHTQFVDYTQLSDFSALEDLELALQNAGNGQVDPSLEGVATLREQFGADIVSMIRTHNLNERGVCGVARFPSTDTLINISNVGISGGSNCIDTFTHEIGHNFGAGHQRVNGMPQGVSDFAGALIVNDKFNTLMSSIGTGDENRNFGLNLFSNPELQCGGVVCGDIDVADNARIINEFAQINADLRSAVSTTLVTPPPGSAIDTDGDGVLDVNDAFPFDSTEFADRDLDGTGDNTDAFPDNAQESLDTDDDGIGNNADEDDDNDGVSDVEDDLPLNANESLDNDGDGIGANSDSLDSDFQDFRDFDGDTIGDKNDLDDDNDGVPDFSIPNRLDAAEAWVASAGTDSILRFNAETGDFIDTLLEVEAGGFSFRSDMALSASQQLFFIAFSDVLEFDRQTGELRTAIDRGALPTNFPSHLSFSGPQNLWVGNGFDPTSVNFFSLTATGNVSASAANLSFVLRDIQPFQNDRLLGISRNNNQVLSFNINVPTVAPTLFIANGLNLPEHMAIDATSNVYITNVGNGTITKHDSSGNFMGTFINAGSGGLGEPSCIAFGPEGDLYICSKDTDQILKFDGETGAFMSVFADGIESGLSQPVSLVFAGLPLDEFRFDAEHDTDGDGVNNSADDLPQDSTETTDTDSDGIGNNADEDDDGDGMPDQFEVDNNFNPLDPSDANEDADGDGSTNIQEFLAGTDPNLATSTPTPPAPEPPVESGGGSGGSMGGIALFILIIFISLAGTRPQKGRLSTHRGV